MRKPLHHRPWLLLTLCATAFAVSSLAQAEGSHSALIFSQMPSGPLASSWHFATLPKKKPTAFTVMNLAGERVLRVSTQDAYGNMVLPLQITPNPNTQLQWRWRVDQLLDKADIMTRAGDDSPIKLCVSFDFDKSQLSFAERTKLRLGKISTGEDIPAETLCYVWDNKLPTGTALHNAFTHRLRYIVLQSGNANKGQWVKEQRNLAADYQQLFGDESQAMPMVIGLVVSADSDNTHGEGLAYMGDIHLLP